MILSKKIKLSKKNPLTPNEEQVLEKLSKRTDIVITKTDKGGAILIENLENYIQEAERQLSNKHYYEKLINDPTHNHQNTINFMIGSLNKQKLITQKVTNTLKINDPRASKFYTLPKILKKGNPGRLVVNSVDCHTSKVLKPVDHYLQSRA